jgi:Subtilase family
MGTIFQGWTRCGGRLLTALLLAAVAACGGDSGEAEGPQDEAVLAGVPTSAALSALIAIEPTPAASQDIAGAYLLTRISVVLKPDATVAELNAAAQAVGATAISFSNPGSPFITLAVPRQPSGAALTELARQLESQPGILFASAGREVELLELPADGDVAAPVLQLDHLLATRFPAAWNVRHQALTPEGNCVSTVTVIFPDYFLGKPRDFDAQMEGSITADPRTSEPDSEEDRQPHGYNTVATLAARFDSQVSTGANPLPKCLKIKLLDGKGLGLVELVDKTIRAVQQEPGRVLLSSSVGYKNSFICGPDGTDECGEADIASSAESIRTHIRDHFVQGILWASFAMRPEVVDRMLIVQAAGNDGSATIGDLYPVLRSARYGSPFAIATVIGGLDALLADVSLWRPVTAAPELPDLSLDAQTVFYLVSNRDQLVLNPVTDRNLVLVGSITNAPTAASVEKHDLSNDGAALFAVGEDVMTFDLTVASGTSYSAPQVAGLVSYLWLLEPTLATRPLQDTVQALLANTQRNAMQGDEAVTGIVDAYATVLSLDESVAPTPVTARMRLAILDLDGDGDFDLEDLRRFHAAYIDSGGLALEPADPDYSRFDLNGDGFTGGSRTVPMDLDPSTSIQFGARVLSEVILAVGGVERPFDERAVTDAQALCYYANTALYTGTDAAARDDALADVCSRVQVAPANSNVTPGGSVQFSTIVSGTTDQRVTWTVPGGGGAITPDGLFTAGAVAREVRVRATSVALPAVSGEAAVVIGPAAATVTISGGAEAIADIRCSNLNTVDTDPPPGEGSGPSGSITKSFDGPNSSGRGSATFNHTYSQTGSGVPAAISGAGEARGTVSSPEGFTNCFDAFARIPDLEAGGGSRVSYTFVVTGGPITYLVSGGATETEGPAFGLIALTGPSGYIYWKDSLGGSEGSPSGILEPGAYIIRGQAGASERIVLLDGQDSDSESATFNFTLSLGSP